MAKRFRRIKLTVKARTCEIIVVNFTDEGKLNYLCVPVLNLNSIEYSSEYQQCGKKISRAERTCPETGPPMTHLQNRLRDKLLAL